MPAGPHRLAFEAFGVVVEVTVADGDLLHAVREVLPPGRREAQDRAASASFSVLGDGTVLHDGSEIAPAEDERFKVLARLGSAIRDHVALHAPAHVFVHAGVVALGDAVIVIPGSSHSGKTTLVAELLRAGALYCSDEYAVVDADGWIHPYPKPLGVRATGGDRFGTPVTIPVARVAVAPLRARLVVVTRYEAGVTWAPADLTPGEGALSLLEHTIPAHSRPAESLAAAGRVAGDARVLAGPRGEAQAVARRLVEMARR